MSAPSEVTRNAMRAEANRRLSAEEIRQYLDTPISDFEREQVLELITWFRRRYPTGADRLAYVRRAYALWTANVGPRE